MSQGEADLSNTLSEPSSTAANQTTGHIQKRKPVNQRWPVVLAAAILFLGLLAGGIYFMLSRRGGEDDTLVSFSAMTGTAPRLIQVSNDWLTFKSEPMGLTFRYPRQWKAAEAPDHSSVSLYPPESDPDQPSPLISFSFAPETPYGAEPVTTKSMTNHQTVTIANVNGRQYEDEEFVLPTQGRYIELPHRGGLLFISATKGPAVNLVPQLDEILKTIALEK